MLNIGNKTFMNLQEAVGWLLENNALPFQSTANYVANTEIAMSTLVNPSPAKVRVGSLIFFADSKVSTVIGVTSNSFIVSDQYNDLVDDIVYVSNVAINASGHLICTLSNGDNIDAGLIKQVNNFSIDASQHLIANYNNGTSTDLGAIFTGNVNIAGNFTADSIIENMSGYSFEYQAFTNNLADIQTITYASCVKNGNKLTLVCAGEYNTGENDLPQANNSYSCFRFYLPVAVMDKLIPFSSSYLAFKREVIFETYVTSIDANVLTVKGSSFVYFAIVPKTTFSANKKYYFRYEITFLLSDNMAS